MQVLNQALEPDIIQFITILNYDHYRLKKQICSMSRVLWDATASEITIHDIRGKLQNKKNVQFAISHGYHVQYNAL